MAPVGLGRGALTAPQGVHPRLAKLIARPPCSGPADPGLKSLSGELVGPSPGGWVPEECRLGVCRAECPNARSGTKDLNLP